MFVNHKNDCKNYFEINYNSKSGRAIVILKFMTSGTQFRLE